MKKWFPAYLHKSPAGMFGVSFPDLAVAATGDTIDAAMSAAEDALNAHIEAIIETGGELPAPGNYVDAHNAALDDPELAQGYVGIQMIAAILPEKTERVLITMPGDVLKRLDAATNNRSSFITEAVRAKLAAARTMPLFTLENERMTPLNAEARALQDRDIVPGGAKPARGSHRMADKGAAVAVKK